MATILTAMFSPSAADKIYFGLVNRGHRCINVADPFNLKSTVMSARFDLVLIGINQNEEILKSFITAFKNTDQFKDIPLVAVVNKSSIGEIDSMFKAGADECISKPFKLADLLAKIDNILEKGLPDTNKEDNPIPEILQEHIERIKDEGRPLGDIAEVCTGVSTIDSKAKRLSSPGIEWLPMVINEAVSPFLIGSEREFVLMRKNLIRRIPDKDEYYVEEKVLIKRTLTPLAAAVDTSMNIFSSELYGVQPAKGLSCRSLSCILNSRFTSFFFHRCRPPADDLRSIYLSKSDIQQLPLLVPERKEQKKLDKLYDEISLINQLHSNKTKVTERVNLLKDMNNIIFKTFGITEPAIKVFNSLHF